MSSRAAFAKPLEIAKETRPGVNLVGFLEGELGLGENPRRLARALGHAGVDFAAISYRRTPSRQEHPLDVRAAAEAPYDTNIICLNADYLHEFLSDAGVEFFAGRYSIGVWAWETSIFRRENHAAFRLVDEVWCVSEYVRRAVAAVDPGIPIGVAPIPVEVASPTTAERSALGLPSGFLFLFLFDFVSYERKNPMALVDAYTRAFGPRDGANLVLKSINGRERKQRQLEELKAATDGRMDIVVLDGYVSPSERNSMVAACDCYVSLHRSEGFGLTMADAMSYGKPVIATGYSGNLDFMDETSSYLVPYRLVPVPPEWWAYAPGAEWADPDVAAASALMRHVYENQHEANARGARGRAEILDCFSLERMSKAIAHRLGEARTRGAVTARTSGHDARPSILEASQEVSRGAGESLLDRRGSPPTSLVRRLLHRALWPYLRDQQRFEQSVLDALTGLQRSVDDLEQRIVQLEHRSDGPEAHE